MPLREIDLGRIDYAAGYEAQCAHHAEVLAARDAGDPVPGVLLLLEHEPVITISNRPTAGGNLIATPAQLAAAGVAVARTDRGGDITYHGPGQLVVYPILDLNLLNLGLHDYMRLLEDAVIDTCGVFGVTAGRDRCATGVWVGDGPAAAKVCAMGVRVRRWASMHGLALNVTTNLDHFALINPCGLGRPVTSLERLLGPSCPSMAEVKSALAAVLRRRAEVALRTTAVGRAAKAEGDKRQANIDAVNTGRGSG